MIAASRPRPAMTRNACRRGPDGRPLADVLLEVGLVGVQPHPADVDVPVAPGDGDLHRLRQVVGRHLEVAGEQVAGAAGEQAHRHAGVDHLLGHGAHGAVAAEGAHDVDVLGEGLTGLAEADVVLRGLDEQRLVPAVLRADPGDDLVHVVARAVELGRVEHHRQPLARGRRGVVDGAEAVAGRAARRALAVTARGQQQPQPGQHENDGDGDAHPGPPRVRHSVEGTAPRVTDQRRRRFRCVVFPHEHPAARGPRRPGRRRDHPGRQGLDLDPAGALPRLRVHRRRRRGRRDRRAGQGVHRPVADACSPDRMPRSAPRRRPGHRWSTPATCATSAGCSSSGCS